MRKLIVGTAVVALASASAVVVGTGAAAEQADSAQESGEQEFVVVYTEGVSLDAAHAAVAAAGGTIVSENTDVGVATVVTTNGDFAAAAGAEDALMGTAQNRVIGAAPDLVVDAGEGQKFDPAEADLQLESGSPSHGQSGGNHGPNAEPLADLQWDMQQIGATVDGSYRFQKGKASVLVGIIDTGVDGSHPDIAPNFNAELSRNFTVDIPVDANGASIDGACAAEPDQSCNDPSNVDEHGHGTHVASTIASPINGIGIAGVAPKATIVNLRAGQDSG
ncbi:MAG TPA: S8 family serine peptidase, partial [Ilumatobacteraceae bacterium]|nr:S8 family serine peptidase [Ilumatobacteraceae bacterium]